MIPLAFHGGTALRFLYSTQRYSEDLDSALDTPVKPMIFAAFENDSRHFLCGRLLR